MTLDEAILELSQWNNTHWFQQYPHLAGATQLGIEALKWRRLIERDYGSWVGPLLPGETEE